MHSQHAQCCLPRCFGPDACETLKAGQAWPKQVCVPGSEGLQIGKGMCLQDAVEQAAVLLPEQQQHFACCSSHEAACRVRWVCVRALQIAFGVVRARAGCLQVTLLRWRRLEQLQGPMQALSCQGADKCLVYGCGKQHVRYYELILQPTRGPWPLKAWPTLQARPALSPRAAQKFWGPHLPQLVLLKAEQPNPPVSGAGQQGVPVGRPGQVDGGLREEAGADADCAALVCAPNRDAVVLAAQGNHIHRLQKARCYLM